MSNTVLRSTILLALAMLASSCVGSASVSTEVEPVSTSEATPQVTAPPTSAVAVTTTEVPASSLDAPVEADAAPPPAEPEPITEFDLQRFLAAAEYAIVGTSYEGQVYETPEIYIATAQAFCSRMSQGDSLGALLSDYLSSAGTEAATDEDLQFVGAILGAGIQTLCPEHSSKI